MTIQNSINKNINHQNTSVMEIFAKNEKIQSLENWKNNISISQWKEGRSAYSLAKYFISHKKDAEDLIQSMLEFVSERENKELSIKDVVA